MAESNELSLNEQIAQMREQLSTLTRQLIKLALTQHQQQQMNRLRMARNPSDQGRNAALLIKRREASLNDPKEVVFGGFATLTSTEGNTGSPLG